jgi:hypothetical protein
VVPVGTPAAEVEPDVEAAAELDDPAPPPLPLPPHPVNPASNSAVAATGRYLTPIRPRDDNPMNGFSVWIDPTRAAREG